MFKRILKVVGFVLLGFVLLIGGVVAFMAIRGDFKKQVIKPTAISFSIDKTDLLLDASITETPTQNNGRVHSFTIKAEPADVNVVECTLKLSSPLITFVKWDKEKGEWIENATNTFHLNTPIYFVVNNVVEDTATDKFQISKDNYYDGVLTITVKDKSGLLQDTLKLEIDRAVTSISFVDQYKPENNVISTNGLFGYELNADYQVESWQKLEVIQKEDYPLEIITAPLKASKPFSGTYPDGDSRNFEKIQEVYYVKDGQNYPLMVIDDGDTENKFNPVKLGVANEITGEIEPKLDCDFLTYDEENDKYVFNSKNSGSFEFLLATYPTYAIQNRISSQDMSFIERLQSVEEDGTKTMITKKVVITVSGTEADNVEFKGDEGDIKMYLLQDNTVVANNSTTLDMYNLGLTLSKNESNTGINSRYNELKFLAESDFDGAESISWEFKHAEIDDDSKVKYTNEKITIDFFKDMEGKIKASITGLIELSNTYDVELKTADNGISYTLTLTYEDNNAKTYTIITFALQADTISGKTLNIVEDLLIEDDELKQKYTLTTVTVETGDKVENEEGQLENANAETQSIYLDWQVGNCLVLNDVVEERDGGIKIYSFKTLKAGFYLVLLGKDGDDTLLSFINNLFITSISHNNADTIISFKPTEQVEGVQLYAVVVNSNKTYHCTQESRKIIIDVSDSTVELLNDELNVPIIVGDGIIYDSEQFKAFGEGGLFTAIGGSYNQGLLFTTLYTKLDTTTKPKEWDNGLEVYTYSNNAGYTKYSGEYNSSITYYVKNNFKIIDTISYTSEDSETYYLVGYVENNRFVNKVVPSNDGPNYYSKLYPAVISSKYLRDEGRLQTVEEAINEMLIKTGTSNIIDASGTITYNLALEPNNSKIIPTMYLPTIDEFYNQHKTYYIFDEELNQYRELTTEEIEAWDSLVNVLERFNYTSAKEVVETAPETNDLGILYYEINNNSYIRVAEYSKDNWDGYYVVIDYYVVAYSESDNSNIKINALAYTKNENGEYVEFGNKDFTISNESYQNEVGTTFDISVQTLFVDKVITVNSYYNFEEEGSAKPTVQFDGTYFDNPQTYNKHFYTIIAGHKDITVDWTGKSHNDESIGSKVAKTIVSINHEQGENVLRNIFSDLNIKALQYNSNDEYVGEFKGIEISSLNCEYLPASETYDADACYYIVDADDNTKYIKADIGEDVIADWANKYTDYYIFGISAEFEVFNTIGDDYVELEWIYSSKNGEYKIYSQQLRILSRALESYSVDVGLTSDNAENLYIFINAENADANIVQGDNLYKHENEQFVKIEGMYKKVEEGFEIYKYENENYVKLEGQYSEVELFTKNDNGVFVNAGDEDDDKYCANELVATNVDIKYQLNVGYNSANSSYTYKVYAVDENGNILYHLKEDGYNAIAVEVGTAFKLKSEGGWIAPKPLYADNTEFTVVDTDNNNVRVKYNDSGDEIEIKSSRATEDFVQLKLKSKNSDISSIIVSTVDV